MDCYDSLTGLANRRNMNPSLRKAIALAERYGKSLSLAMLDIDFFKRYNDSRGHDTGDRLLAMVA
jgi:diguanylate cyclase (GGDEF)-like protein